MNSRRPLPQGLGMGRRLGETGKRVAVGLPMAAAVAVCVVLAPEPWLAGLAALVVALAAQEWAHLSGLSLPAGWILALAVGVGSLALAQLAPFAGAPEAAWTLAGLAAAYWGSVLALLLRWQLRGGQSDPALAQGQSLPWIWRLAALPLLLPLPLYVYLLLYAGPVGAAPGWMAFVPQDYNYSGRVVLFGALALAVLADVAAYFGGRAWGRRKLASALSSGKTWEGTLCGLAAACLVASATLALLGRQPWLGLPVGLLLGAGAVVGDLYESMVKRMVAAKDSSQLLSAHGGVLDRGDSHFCVLAWGACLVTLARLL